MGTTDTHIHRDLARLEAFLMAISARILQVPERKVGAAMGAATNVAVGSAFTASVFGAIGTLGTAGTGTAIAGLSGAAKTSATLAWIGGIAGGGVAAGTAVLGVGAIGAGIYGSIRIRSALLGHARRREMLSEAEQQILEAATILSATIRNTLEQEAKIDGRELALLSRIGVDPLLTATETALASDTFDDLNAYNRTRLRGHVNNLRALMKRFEAHACPS